MSKLDLFGFKKDIKCVDDSGNVLRSYRTWYNMITRCYDKNGKDYKSYGAKGVYVCDEWRLYSNFKKWYDENYKEGCVMDKDILSKKYSKRFYSPETCQFIDEYDNIKDARDRSDYGYMIKENNPMHRGKKYYENNSVFRANFKKVCNRNGWKFENFQEIWYGEWFKVEGYRRKRKFTYVEKTTPDEVVNVDYNKKDKSYYSTHPTRRETFKKICLRNNWRFEDFEEKWSENEGVKKYFYNLKNGYGGL